MLEIKKEKKIISFKEDKIHNLRNKIKIKKQNLRALSTVYIKSVSEEILTRDFTQTEIDLFSTRGIDRKFKEFSLLEALLIRNDCVSVSYNINNKYIDSHIRISRSRLRFCIQDPSDDMQVQEFMRNLNTVVQDLFIFRLRNYRSNKTTDFGMDIIPLKLRPSL